MQGSAIAGVDVGSATIKLNDDGFYSLMLGAADMGTGCDTTMSQIAADCLCCDLDNIIVHGVDTDVSPYDSGSYASSTAYLTGGAGGEGLRLHDPQDPGEGGGVPGERRRIRWISTGSASSAWTAPGRSA